MIMKCTKFNAGILIHPKDWVEIRFDDPLKARYACAVEVRNGTKYNVPIFYFFSKKAVRDLSEEDQNAIFSRCSMTSKEFKHAMEHVVEPQFDPVTMSVINAEKYMSGTTPGIYQISPYGMDNDPPYGAVVITKNYN